MIARLYRPLVTALLPVTLIACMNSPPTAAESNAAVPLAHTTAPHVSPPHGNGMQMAHAGANDAHGTGTVNSVDPAQHKVNLSHNPIPDIGWPAMTMEFPADPSIDLTAIKPGTRVNFTIEQQPGGMYEIRAITPAGARQ